MENFMNVENVDMKPINRWKKILWFQYTYKIEGIKINYGLFWIKTQKEKRTEKIF